MIERAEEGQEDSLNKSKNSRNPCYPLLALQLRTPRIEDYDLGLFFHGSNLHFIEGNSALQCREIAVNYNYLLFETQSPQMQLQSLSNAESSTYELSESVSAAPERFVTSYATCHVSCVFLSAILIVHFVLRFSTMYSLGHWIFAMVLTVD